MKLCDIFEQSEPLQPGEKRVHTQFRVRDIKRLEDRILKLQDHIEASRELKHTYKSDPQLQQSLDKLIQKLSARRDLMHKVTEYPTRSQQRMVQILESECSDYLNVWRQVNAHDWRTVWLYRGQRTEASVIEGRSRIDRRAKDSHTELADLLDEHLQHLGVKALRRNSIFVTTSRSFAEEFGSEVYLIFPKNGFDFLWTAHRDLVLDSITHLADPDVVDAYMKEVSVWLDAHRTSWSEHELLGNQLKEYLSWSNVSGVMETLRDMKHTPEYAVPEHLLLDLKDLVSDHSVRQQFRPNIQDLAAAMNTDHEILIHGEYWALHADSWVPYLSKALRVQP